MKGISVSKLQSIFNPDDAEVFTEEQLDMLMSDDLVKIKSLVFGVQHFYTLANIYTVRYPETVGEYLPAIMQKSFTKLYSLIKDLNLELLAQREFHFYQDEISIITQSILSLIQHFEHTEEYEKCAKLKGILDILNKE
jgi:hypothetical protein